MRSLPSISLAIILLVSCSRDTAPTQGLVARAGERQVSLASFKRAYLPVVLYGDKFDSPETRLQTLQYLINQKLLAQAGEAAGFDTLSQVKAAHAAAERKALARQMYQTWVREKLPEITPGEIETGLERSRRDLLIRHLFAPSKQIADSLYDLLEGGQESFHTLAQDIYQDTTLSRNGGLLGWMGFGDLDESLEDVAYGLKPGVPSRPVESQYGWHILEVDDWQQSLFASESDLERDRALVARRIGERREKEYAKTILNNFMHGQQIQFNRPVAREVWPKVIAHLQPPGGELEGGNRWQGPEFGAMLQDVQTLREETLVTVNGEPWTVARVLRRLPELNRQHLSGNLYVATSYLIRDDLIAREARKMGLDKLSEVQDEIQDSQDFLLAQVYTAAVADTIRFTSAARKAHYEKYKLERYHAPDSIRVTEIHVPERVTAETLLRQVRQGQDFELLQDQYDEPEPDRENWYWQRTHWPEVYSALIRIAVGAWAGPLPVGEGWSIFQVEERRRWPLPYETVEKQIATEMEQQRFSTTRDILIPGLRERYTVESYPDELAELWQENEE